MKTIETTNAVSTPATTMTIEVKTFESGRFSLKLNGKKVALKTFSFDNGFYGFPADTEIIFNGRKLRYIGKFREFFDTEYLFADENGNGVRHEECTGLLWSLAHFGTHDVSRQIAQVAIDKKAYFVRTKIESEQHTIDAERTFGKGGIKMVDTNVFNLLPDFADDDDDDELIDEPDATIENDTVAIIDGLKEKAANLRKERNELDEYCYNSSDSEDFHKLGNASFNLMLLGAADSAQGKVIEDARKKLSAKLIAAEHKLNAVNAELAKTEDTISAIIETDSNINRAEYRAYQARRAAALAQNAESIFNEYAVTVEAGEVATNAEIEQAANAVAEISEEPEITKAEKITAVIADAKDFIATNLDARTEKVFKLCFGIHASIHFYLNNLKGKLFSELHAIEDEMFKFKGTAMKFYDAYLAASDGYLDSEEMTALYYHICDCVTGGYSTSVYDKTRNIAKEILDKLGEETLMREIAKVTDEFGISRDLLNQSDSCEFKPFNLDTEPDTPAEIEQTTDDIKAERIAELEREIGTLTCKQQDLRDKLEDAETNDDVDDWVADNLMDEIIAVDDERKELIRRLETLKGAPKAPMLHEKPGFVGKFKVDEFGNCEFEYNIMLEGANFTESEIEHYADEIYTALNANDNHCDVEPQFNLIGVFGNAGGDIKKFLVILGEMIQRGCWLEFDRQIDEAGNCLQQEVGGYEWAWLESLTTDNPLPKPDVYGYEPEEDFAEETPAREYPRMVIEIPNNPIEDKGNVITDAINRNAPEGWAVIRDNEKLRVEYQGKHVADVAHVTNRDLIVPQAFFRQFEPLVDETKTPAQMFLDDRYRELAELEEMRKSPDCTPAAIKTLGEMIDRLKRDIVDAEFYERDTVAAACKAGIFDENGNLMF